MQAPVCPQSFVTIDVTIVMVTIRTRETRAPSASECSHFGTRLSFWLYLAPIIFFDNISNRSRVIVLTAHRHTHTNTHTHTCCAGGKHFAGYGWGDVHSTPDSTPSQCPLLMYDNTERTISHVLAYLLPDKTNVDYDFRPRRHYRQLTLKLCKLYHNNFYCSYVI